VARSLIGDMKLVIMLEILVADIESLHVLRLYEGAIPPYGIAKRVPDRAVTTHSALGFVRARLLSRL
jgi:hypothetical protein